MTKVDWNTIIPMNVDESYRGQQPLSEDEKAFVESAYELYEQFRQGNRVFHDEIRDARKIRALKDDKLDIGNTDPRRASPQLNTLNSTIDNMIADQIDNTPEAIMEPETPELAPIADDMTDVVGWALDHAGFKKEWRRGIDDSITVGTSVIQVFYDEEQEYGGERGGIVLETWRTEDWFPDPAYSNFQDGRAVFKVSIQPLSFFYQHYPDDAKYIEPDAYVNADSLDVAQKEGARYSDPLVALLEVWFRRYDPDEKRYEIHMATLAGHTLLYDSRKDHPNGVYDHGMYPFITQRFRERDNTAFGTGMVYEFAPTQRIINRYIRYIDENARASSKPKLMVSKNAGVDMDSATDFEKDVVEADMIGPTVMDWFQAAPLNGQIMSTAQWLQDTQKQDSGQNQFSRGEGGLGVTAASAISMLQEAGGKITRLHNALFMESFKELVEQVIALIAQYFTESRTIMITGRDDNSPQRPATLNSALFTGLESTYGRPAATVRVQVQRSNPQQISAFNQLVLEMSQISAQSNSPIPASVIMRSLRVTGKKDIVKMLEENDAQQQMMAQLQQQAEQLALENEQLNAMLQQAGQEMQAKDQMLSAASQQLQSATPPRQTAPTAAVGQPRAPAEQYGSATALMSAKPPTSGL